MVSLMLPVSVTVGPVILCILLLTAAWIDCRTFRIPNRLVASGLGIGLFLNMALPAGDGFLGMTPGALGLWPALQGAAVGFALLLPLYLTRTMGAGDVKLIAMIGAFVGSSAMLDIILLSFIFGGALSLVVAIKNKKLQLFLTNVYEMLFGFVLSLTLRKIGKLEPPQQSVGNMPYALAITGGTFLYLILGNRMLWHGIGIF